MSDCQCKPDLSAQAVPEHVRLLNLELFQKSRRVIRHLLASKRTSNVGGAPVSLQVNGNHLSALGECRIDVCRHESTVKQYKRSARAVNLVIHFEIAHRSVFALD